MSQDVSDGGVRRRQGLAVFDVVEDRPSVFGDPSTVPEMSWNERARGADSVLESSRPRAARPRVRRGSAAGWLPGLLVFGVVVAGGLTLLSRLLR